MTGAGRAALVLTAVGAAVLVVLAWTGLADADAGTRGAAVVTLALVLGGVWLGIAVVVRRARTAHRELTAALPGWSLHCGWADASLATQLVRSGTWERGLRPGSPVVIGWSAAGVALWRTGAQPRQLVAATWSHVDSVTVARGFAGSTGRPALGLDMVGGQLVVTPCARANGGVLPASHLQVQQLVATLRSTRPDV